MGIPIEKLNVCHAEHKLYSPSWLRFDVLAASGVRLEMAADDLLVKRPKEPAEVFAERVRRMTYENILGTALGWYTAALFKRNPRIDITGGGDWYEKTFLENCDRAGTTYNDTWREVFKHLFLYRTSYVLIDKPHADVVPQTRAEEQELGIDNPYIVVYSPRDVINWSDDASGNLEWAVTRTITQVGGFLEEPELVTRWTYYDATDYRVFEHRRKLSGGNYATLYDASGNVLNGDSKEAQELPGGQHALASVGRVPIRRIKVSDEMWMANRVALQVRDHFNQDNTLAWALMNSNLAMPVVFSEKEVRNITFAEISYLQLGPQDKFQWTEPAGNSFAISQQRLDTVREEIFRTLYLQSQGRDSSATASASSGYSKEMDRVPANEALNGFGDKIRTGMQDVGNDVSIARGDGATWDVSGFKFESKPVIQSITVGQMMNDFGVLDASPTLEKEVFQGVAEDWLEDRNEELKTKVRAEIAAYPPAAARKNAEQLAEQQSFQMANRRITARSVISSEQDSVA